MKKISFALLILIFVSLSGISPADAFAVTDYVNPQGIVLASPADGYVTSGRGVSILGSCDYRYPLYMDGELVETTPRGFFSVYVKLKSGDNVFEFENNGQTLTLKVIRKKSSGGGGAEPEYIEYPKGVYGIVVSDYAMTRADIYSQSPELIPLTENTQLRLLGEKGGFYQIYDGSYVAKSSISKYEDKMPANSVKRVYMEDDTKNNVLRLIFDMDLNVPYRLSAQEDGTLSIRLFETAYAPRVTYRRNDTVKKILVKPNPGDWTTDFIITLKRDGFITGYDSSYENGRLTIYLKKAPHLKSLSSLEGAVILLDAGHGDDDKGALGPLGESGPVEKDFNLNITLYASQYLRERGASVVLTRDRDVFLSLSERVRIIRELRPDISVAIHGNSLPQESDYSKAKGFLTFYTYNFTGNVPERINRYVADFMDFGMSEPRRKSLSLTRLTACPAVLLETLFLSNPYDYEFLLSSDNQKLYGRSIGRAIEKYIMEAAVHPGIRRHDVKVQEEV